MRYSVDDNIPKPAGEKRFDYQADQMPIKLAAQEALLRYPTTKFKERLEWRVAFADAILDNPTSDEWLLNQLEAGLNSGSYKLDDLSRMLDGYGFTIAYSRPAPNLFGDGQPAQVWWITLKDGGDTGLYAGLEKEASGRYRLTKIRSTWDFNFGVAREAGDSPFTLQDHTGDGVPEVTVLAGYLNGTMACGYFSYIYQWETDHFVNLLPNLPFQDSCGPDSGSWGYGSLDSHGVATIEVRSPGTTTNGVYQWNGTQYVLQEVMIKPLAQVDSSAFTWLYDVWQAGDYQMVVDVLQSALTNHQVTQIQSLGAGNPTYDIGPGFVPYLWFQLGQAYTMLSKPALAQQAFQQSLGDSQHPLAYAVAQAAQAYLNDYHGKADLYRACQAALTIMAQAAGEHVAGVFVNRKLGHLIIEKKATWSLSTIN